MNNQCGNILHFINCLLRITQSVAKIISLKLASHLSPNSSKRLATALI